MGVAVHLLLGDEQLDSRPLAFLSSVSFDEVLFAMLYRTGRTSTDFIDYGELLFRCDWTTGSLGHPLCPLSFRLVIHGFLPFVASRMMYVLH